MSRCGNLHFPWQPLGSVTLESIFFGKHYFNKYWKGLNALGSSATNQKFTEVNCGKISLILWCFEPALRLFFCILDFSNQESIKALNYRYQHIMSVRRKCLQHHTAKHSALMIIFCFFGSSATLCRWQRRHPVSKLACLGSAQVLYFSLIVDILSLDILFRLWIEQEILVLSLTLMHDPRHCKRVITSDNYPRCLVQ